ncbi:hypothetical protein G6011_07531 [Alternaria panax]|uniref:Uncharacterized protein n=1 Tax=Alternaria panax TaxID=48097 RepID=A0AAD4FFS1_9PLEO|nr:hypothetical protein G6011_07531 [Alternaria panax]
MALFRALISTFSFFISIPLSSAKLQETYVGIATDDVQACIQNSDFTRETIILKQNCREAFKYVMDNILNYGQTILSSGLAIVEFVPTVHLILGPSNADIMRIHARYPILSFFLSITNINKTPDRSHNVLHEATYIVPLGLYSFLPVNSPGLNTRLNRLTIWTAHMLSFVDAALLIWRTYDIGKEP